MPVHVAKQGDCMSSIADQYGFFWETLWYHEKNAELRERRHNPNVLMQGDRVFVPEIHPKEESGETAKTHSFHLKGVPARLNLRLLDVFGDPRVGVKYKLTVDGKKTEGIVPDDGLISEIIPPRAAKGQLELETGEEFELNLGYLNPEDSNSGVQARLKNLGYYLGEITGKIDDETQEALRAFQRDRELPETGEADDATREALASAHES